MGEVAGAPVHRGAHRAHERRQQRHHQQPQGHRRQQLHRQQWIALLPVGLGWEQHHRRQRHQNPGPTAQQIVHRQKHPAGHPRLPFIAGGQQPLNEFAATVAAAKAPPLQGDVSAEGGHRDTGTLQPLQLAALDAPWHKGQQLGPSQGTHALQQGIHAASGMDRSQRNGHRAGQGQHQLQHVGHHHSPQPAGSGVDQHQQRHARQQRQLGLRGGGEPEGIAHLGHGEEGIAHADAIDRQGEQKGLDAAQPSRSGTAVTQLRESRIGEHPAAAPQRRKHHGHRHMGHPEAPPLPVARQAAQAHQPSHVERCVHREGGGCH